MRFLTEYHPEKNNTVNHFQPHYKYRFGSYEILYVITIALDISLKTIIVI